jgi:hypothetical protein
VNLESREFWIVTLAVVFLIHAAFLAFSRWCLHSPAVPEEKLNRLRLGMTAAEVTHLLGRPCREVHLRDRPEWHYGHRLKSHVLRLRFGSDGRLCSFQDGVRHGGAATGGS